MRAGASSTVAAVTTLLLLAILAPGEPPTAEKAEDDRNNIGDDEWRLFKRQNNKNYNSEIEENFRKSVYQDNKRKIMEHNAKYEKGLFSYKTKINQFGDMLSEEYDNYMHPVNKKLSWKTKHYPRTAEFNKPEGTLNIKNFVDWRTQGAVTPVQDQGLTCGSCWAFSAIGALEAQYFIKTGALIALSAQSLLDCSLDYGNMGCAGGSAALSFQFVADRKGIEPEASYSYEGSIKECPYNLSIEIDENSGPCIGYIDRDNEDTLKIAVATIGPISTGIDGSHDTFRFYSEGIYYHVDCNKYDINHAVLIIGYGTDLQNRDFWLVKNSWGKAWGKNGYFKIARNKNNHCGIASETVYPII